MAKKKSNSKSSKASTSRKVKTAAPRQSRKAAEKVLRDGPIRKRARQPRLPGVEEDPGSKKIDDAAFAYVEARDARIAASTEENRRATKLIALVKNERPGSKAYRHTVGGEVITVNLTVKDPTEKVKVKIAPIDERGVGEIDTAAEQIDSDVHAMDEEAGFEATE